MYDSRNRIIRTAPLIWRSILVNEDTCMLHLLPQKWSHLARGSLIPENFLHPAIERYVRQADWVFDIHVAEPLV
jgi:hypothetical protein